jgi:hypothetical protein
MALMPNLPLESSLFMSILAPQTQIPQPPAPPTPTPAVPAGATDLAALQSQLADLQIQRASLKAQWDGLQRQLERMLQTNPSRPAVVKEWADVGSQMARVDGQIAAVEARIAQQQGAPIGRPIVRINPPGRQVDPDLPIAGGIAIMLALVLPLSIAWAIRILRRPQPSAPRGQDMGPRFDRLEQAVDAIAIEVERISEGQRFVTKILAERVSPAEPLGLGAGPAERIEVGERQGVRQSR